MEVRAGRALPPRSDDRACRGRTACLRARGASRPSPDVWTQVEFGREIYVSQRAENDTEDGVYLSLECSCDWEPEHGLQLVCRDGRAVSKVGPFDGHVTNSDAFAKPSLAGVVYKTIASTVADFRRGR
jgi:hypothetical protein